MPWGVNRRRVVTLNDGVPGERSISVACMHCSDAPCMAVCPVDCFYRTDEGVVLHDKDLCIGCGYCFYACPFGAPQFPQTGAFGAARQDGQVHVLRRRPRGRTAREAEFEKYGRNRLAEGKLPACAEMCSTKALLGGDGDVVADIYRNRVAQARQGRRGLGLGHGLRLPTAGRRAQPAPAQRRPQPARRRRDQIMSARRGCVVAALAVALALAGCGERPQVINYKQGNVPGQARHAGLSGRAVQRQQAAVGQRDR